MIDGDEKIISDHYKSTQRNKNFAFCMTYN